MQRIEASLDIGLADDAPGRDGNGEALELLRTEIDHLKQPGDQPMCTVTYDDGARLGRGLQACSEIGRFPNDSLFLSRSFTNQVADHDQTSSNANAGRRGVCPVG